MTTLQLRKVDPDLIRDCKIEALKQGKSLKQFTEEALREKVERSK